MKSGARKVNSHMPYRARLKGEEVFLFCLKENDWKIYFSVDGETYRVDTDAPPEFVECNPVIHLHNDKIVLSFISGTHSLMLRKKTVDNIKDLAGKSEIINIKRTFSGFCHKDKVYHAEHVGDHPQIYLNGKQILRLPRGMCYRLSCVFDNPEQLLCSGEGEGEIYSLLIDLITGEQYKIFDGAKPAYKASLFYGQLEHAHKCGEKFEDRRIIMAEDPQFKPANIASILKV